MSPDSSSRLKIADSFVFRESTQRQEKRRPTRRRNNSRHGRTSLSQQQQQLARTASDQDDTPEPIRIPEIANLLQGVTIHIDKNLAADARLGSIASGLGAALSDSLDGTVTHVVHGPSAALSACSSQNNINKQRIPRLVSQALDRGMRVVSPAWIYECFEKRKRLPEMYYPFDMDSTCRLDFTAAPAATSASSRARDNDNIFDLPEEELASSEEEEEEEEEPDSDMYQETRQDRASDSEERMETYITPRDSVTPAPLQQCQTNAGGEHELVSSAEEEARLERRQKRLAEIAKIKAAKKRQRDPADHDHDEDDISVSYDASEGGNAVLAGRDQLEIWYGEQSFYQEYDRAEAMARTPSTARRSGRSLSRNPKRSR